MTRFLLPLWIILAWGLAAGWAAGQTPADDEAVRAAAEGLAGQPWYDREKDDLKRIDVQPPEDLENRHSQWEQEASQQSWDVPEWLEKLSEFLAWSLLAVVLGVLVYLMVKSFMNLESERALSSTDAADVALRGDVDRVEALPFQLPRPRGDLLDEARRHYEQGRYAEAMVYLYSYQLLQLDKYQVIRLTRGKTNRQYLREVPRSSTLFDLMQHSMVLFEDVFFGQHDLDRRRFESCWNQLDEFHQRLEVDHAAAV